MAPKCSYSKWSVRIVLQHKMVGIGSGRAAGVSCAEVFGGDIKSGRFFFRPTPSWLPPGSSNTFNCMLQTRVN